MKTTRIISLMFLAAFLVFTLSAQWTQAPGPYGGSIIRVFPYGTSLFAGVGGCVYRSTDDGTSWTPVNSGLSVSTVIAFASNGTSLFAGGGWGMNVSTNNGDSWTSISNGISFKIVTAIDTSGTDLFAGTTSGVYRSTNQGETWTEINSGLTNLEIQSLARIGSNLFAGTGGSGVFLTTDNGANWVPANTGIESGYVTSIVASGTNLFAAIEDSVYLSADSGASWTSLGNGLASVSISCLAINGTDLYAGASNGAFRSTDNGGNWTSVSSGLTSSSLRCLASRGGTVFAGTYGGVFMSTNNGADWTPINTGILNTTATSMLVNDPDLFVGTEGGLFLSADTSATWSSVNSGLPSRASQYVANLVVDGSNLFAGTNGDGVFLSTDNGASWSQCNTGINPYIRAVATHGSYLFAAVANGGVFRSTDNGSNWESASAGLTNMLMTALIVDGSNLVAGTNGGGVFVSTDDGANWSPASTNPTNLDIRALGMCGTYLFAGTEAGVFLSTDHGSNWSLLSSSPTSLVNAFAARGSSLFAGTETSVFVSNDYGETWTNITPSELGSVGVRAMAVLEGYKVFIGTVSKGIWWAQVGSFVSLAAPSELSVADSGNGSVTLKWRRDNGPDFHCYRIYGGTSPNPVARIDSTDGGQADTSKTITGLVNGTRYYFRVTAVNTARTESEYSNEVSAIPYDPAVPLPPVNVVVTDSSSKTITIKWGKNTEPDFLRYRIYRDTSPNPTTKVDSTSGGVTDTTKTFTGLTNGTRYYFRVTAVDSTGNESSYSDAVSAVPADRLAPSAPSNLVVTDSSSGTISLEWGKNVEPDLLCYRIYRGTSSNPTTKVDSATGSSDTSKTFTGLTNGTRYYFRVTAVDSTGNESGYSNETNAVPGDRIPPASPANLVVTDSSSKTITVKWRTSAETDFLRYRIYRGISAAPTSEVDSTTAGITDTSRTFTGLTNGTRYYVRVTAVDSAGNESPYSNEVNAAPADRIPPAAPQNLIVFDSTSTKVGITWKKSTEADFLRYRIYGGTSAGPTVVVDSTTGGVADTSKTFTGLANGTRYYLRVTAIDSAGNESAYSNEVNAAPNAALGVDDLSSRIPKEFSMSQNYPNPFNPTAIIQYDLPKRVAVRLTVFDMLGREVKTLVSALQEPGYYKVVLDARGLSSGVYYYRIQAGDFVKVKKLLLVK
jgi:fibronectin type 3 domain-containing protein/photosystem II stability/assembly factor-like uncharacterized protein